MRDYGTTNAAPNASAPAVGAAGDTYWNTTDKSLYVSDGTAWVRPSIAPSAVRGTPASGGTAREIAKASIWAGDDLVDLSIPTAKLQAGAVTFAKLGERVHAQILRSTVQSAPSATQTTILWTGGATIDVGGAWNAGQNDRLTIPTTGYYLVGAQLSFTGSAAGTVRRLLILRPAIQNIAIVDGRPVAADQMVNLTILWPFNAGEFISVQVYQDSGGALNVGPDGWAVAARFWLTRVG